MNADYVILIVEDEADDRALLAHAFQKARIENPLQMVDDGDEAVDYLAGSGPYADRERFPLPRLIFADFGVPETGALRLLKWLHAHDGGSIPVIVMPGSEYPQKIERALSAGAREAFIKPAEHGRLVELIRNACEKWLPP